VYDRASAAVARSATDRFDWAAIAEPEFFHLSGITLGLSASCFELGVRAMEEARRHGATVTFDVNYRQRLWPPEAAATAIRSVAQLIDVLVCTREDARDLFGAGDDPETAVLHVQAELGVEVGVGPL